MNAPLPYLATLVQAQSVIERLAEREGVSPRTVRVVGALRLAPHSTIPQISRLIGCHYYTGYSGAREAIGKGWVQYAGATYKLSLTLAGLGMYRAIEQAERAARIGIEQPAKGPKRRKYVRSGKYIGRGTKKLSE